MLLEIPDILISKQRSPCSTQTFCSAIIGELSRMGIKVQDGLF